MRAAADLLIVASTGTATQERGGLVGKVQAIVFEHPGLTTREIRELVREPSFRVSGALSTLKHEGTVVQDRSGSRIRWTLPGVESPPRTDVQVDAWCRCGTSINFGSLATDDDRARPRCSVFPFALQGAA